MSPAYRERVRTKEALYVKPEDMVQVPGARHKKTALVILTAPFSTPTAIVWGVGHEAC